MSNEFKRKLLKSVFISAATLSILSYNASFALAGQRNFGWNQNDARTDSPIKHVIVIVGENRTFDHIFATYQAPHGAYVDNLLSKGIINKDGTPGPNYAVTTQFSAQDTTTYSINPGSKVAYGTSSNPVQAPGTSYAPLAPYPNIYDPITGAAVNGPGAVANIIPPGQTYTLPQQAEGGLPTPPGQPHTGCCLLPQDLPLLTTGSTGLSSSWPDSRINGYSNLPGGVYPLVTATGQSLYDTYGGSPVHRFYQMWQELDCDATKATWRNPSGCQADLFPWVEITVSAGSNGAPFPNPAPVPLLKEGDIATGYYNVANGDAPYFKELADTYTLADNYHQPVMGGTFANSMVLGYADALYYADANGNPAVPPANQIENPNPQSNTNNWYSNDGYGSQSTQIGGSYTNCSDTTQPGVTPIVTYLKAINIKPNCQSGAYYLLNNYVPAFIGSGAQDPTNNGPFTLPPVIKQRHIGDVLSASYVSWAYFGDRWNDFKTAPGLGANYGTIDPAAYLYCNICNPFLYSASTMTNQSERDAHLKDTTDLYDAIASGNLPAVSYVKPSTFVDGHPASSKFSLFEAFTKDIIQHLQANRDLWESTAVFVTVDEGGGYYDSGYVQPVDYFGDGTRIPLLIVSPYSRGGHVAHQYSDHASILKFIERNWDLPHVSNRARDNLPNPVTSASNPYVPQNRPAISDLWSAFDFGRHQRHEHEMD
jgi:phospholipase C